jgi:acid stress chaperone HdeB
MTASVQGRRGLTGHGLADSGRALQSIDRDGVAEGSNDQQSGRGNDADASFGYRSGIDIRSRNSSGCARAQVMIDVSKITCHQWVDREVGDPRDIAIWLSGYYHGKRGETTVDKVKLANEYLKEVRDYCLRNPQTLLMQAVETLIERTR